MNKKQAHAIFHPGRIKAKLLVLQDIFCRGELNERFLEIFRPIVYSLFCLNLAFICPFP